MPKKAKTLKKKGENPVITAVFQQVQDVTDVPEARFSDKRNRDSNSLLARNLAISLLRLSGLGLNGSIEPFGLKSTQTVYQAAKCVREAVKVAPEMGTQIRGICANLRVDPTPLLGVEHKKALVPKMADPFIAAAEATTASKEGGTDDAISFAGLVDWERGALAGVLYRMWKGRNPKSAARISDESGIPIDQVNAWLVEIDELARVNPKLFSLLNEQ